jgi:hypothetical protein
MVLFLSGISLRPSFLPRACAQHPLQNGNDMMRAEPQPYWRGRMSENMTYHTDIVTEKSYTICWQGAILHL